MIKFILVLSEKILILFLVFVSLFLCGQNIKIKVIDIGEVFDNKRKEYYSTKVHVRLINQLDTNIFFRNFCRNVFTDEYLGDVSMDCDIQYRVFSFDILNYGSDTSTKVSLITKFIDYGSKEYIREMNKAKIPKLYYLKKCDSLDLNLELRLLKKKSYRYDKKIKAILKFDNSNQFEPIVYPKERLNNFKAFRGIAKSDTFLILLKK